MCARRCRSTIRSRCRQGQRASLAIIHHSWYVHIISLLVYTLVIAFSLFFFCQSHKRVKLHMSNRVQGQYLDARTCAGLVAYENVGSFLITKLSVTDCTFVVSAQGISDSVPTYISPFVRQAYFVLIAASSLSPPLRGHSPGFH